MFLSPSALAGPSTRHRWLQQRGRAAIGQPLPRSQNDLPLLSESVRKYAREVGRLKGDREVPGITPTTIRRALLASQMVHGLDVPEDLRATCEGVLSRLRTVHDLAVAGVDPWPENMAGLLLGNIEQLGGRAGLPEDVMKSVVDLRKKRDAIPEPRGYRGRSLKDEQKREKVGVDRGGGDEERAGAWDMQEKG